MAQKRILVGAAILIVAFFLIYNSKRDYYKNKVSFYDKNITGVITKIKKTRGTKVYYGQGKFFYLEAYDGVHLREGDSISKFKQKIKVYSKETKDGNYRLIGQGRAIKQPSSYFVFFFS